MKYTSCINRRNRTLARTWTYPIEFRMYIYSRKFHFWLEKNGKSKFRKKIRINRRDSRSTLFELEQCFKNPNIHFFLWWEILLWNNITRRFKLRDFYIITFIKRTKLKQFPVPSELVPSEQIPSVTVPSDTVPSYRNISVPDAWKYQMHQFQMFSSKCPFQMAFTRPKHSSCFERHTVLLL